MPVYTFAIDGRRHAFEGPDPQTTARFAQQWADQVSARAPVTVADIQRRLGPKPSNLSMDLNSRARADVADLDSTIADVRAHPTSLLNAPKVLGAVARYAPNAFGLAPAAAIDQVTGPAVRGVNSTFGTHYDPHGVTDQILNAAGLLLGGGGELPPAVRVSAQGARTPEAILPTAARIDPQTPIRVPQEALAPRQPVATLGAAPQAPRPIQVEAPVRPSANERLTNPPRQVPPAAAAQASSLPGSGPRATAPPVRNYETRQEYQREMQRLEPLQQLAGKPPGSGRPPPVPPGPVLPPEITSAAEPDQVHVNQYDALAIHPSGGTSTVDRTALPVGPSTIVRFGGRPDYPVIRRLPDPEPLPPPSSRKPPEVAPPTVEAPAKYRVGPLIVHQNGAVAPKVETSAVDGAILPVGPSTIVRFGGQPNFPVIRRLPDPGPIPPPRPREMIARQDDEFLLRLDREKKKLLNLPRDDRDRFFQEVGHITDWPLSEDPNFQGYDKDDVEDVRDNLSDMANRYRSSGPAGKRYADAADRITDTFMDMVARQQPDGGDKPGEIFNYGKFKKLDSRSLEPSIAGMIPKNNPNRDYFARIIPDLLRPANRNFPPPRIMRPDLDYSVIPPFNTPVIRTGEIPASLAGSKLTAPPPSANDNAAPPTLAPVGDSGTPISFNSFNPRPLMASFGAGWPRSITGFNPGSPAPNAMMPAYLGSRRSGGSQMGQQLGQLA